MRNVSGEKKKQKIKKHILRQQLVSKQVLFMDNVEKYCTAGQATVDNTAHVQFMLET